MKAICPIKIMLISAYLLFTSVSLAQETKPVTKKEIKELVQKLADSLAYYYVDYDEGRNLGNLILENEKKGLYKSLIQPDTLAKRLTEDLRNYNRDLHLRIWHRPTVNTSVRLNEVDLKGKSSNYGIIETKILNDNIGFLKFSHFSDWQYFEEAKKAISSAMKVVEDTDAIIFDVRDNPGGVPHLVSYLISYLFDDKRIHLTDYVHRFNKGGYSVYTQTDLPGKRLPHTPVFVLVNEKTGSAGEEFAYWLKCQKRATIVGSTTLGAGYGAMRHTLNDRFVATISSEEEKNPITNTGFQGVGVIPHIKVDDSENALSVVLELAKKEAVKIKSERNKNFNELQRKWESIGKNTRIAQILPILRECYEAGVADRSVINRMGYHFLNEWNSPQKAEEIFRLNVELHPNSANVYDSYGDALEANGNINDAALNFEKALRLGAANDSPYMRYFISNYNRLKSSLSRPISEKEKIEAVLNDYINGTQRSDVSLLKQAFHKNLNLYSISDEGTLNELQGQQYISYFEDGKPRNRESKIISIDFENDAAIAKIHIVMPERKRIYTDYLMLMKIHEQWIIVHKSFTFKEYD